MRLPLTLLALLLIAPAVSAQTTFGFQAGLNVASLNFEDEVFEGIDEQARLGLVAGVFARVPLTPTVSFQPEVNFSQKGHKLVVEDEDLGLDGSLTYQLGYIEVPLLAHVAIPVGTNGLTVGVEVGPALAYRINSGISCSGDFSGAFCDNEDAFEDEASKFDVGAVAGAAVGAGPFSVALRYTHGFIDLNDSETAGDDASVLNRAFTVAARYTLGR